MDNLTLIYALAALVLICLIWLAVLQIRLGRLMKTYRQLVGGVKPGNLEQMMAMHVGRINEHDQQMAGLDRELRSLAHVLEGAVQKVGLVRFNPFDETGGDQSFAIALLDQRGDGLVLSSLHNRTDTRVYAKPIQDGKSPYTLSEEEEEALGLANRAERAG